MPAVVQFLVRAGDGEDDPGCRGVGRRPEQVGEFPVGHGGSCRVSYSARVARDWRGARAEQEVVKAARDIAFELPDALAGYPEDVAQFPKCFVLGPARYALSEYSGVSRA